MFCKTTFHLLTCLKQRFTFCHNFCWQRCSLCKQGSFSCRVRREDTGSFQLSRLLFQRRQWWVNFANTLTVANSKRSHVSWLFSQSADRGKRRKSYRFLTKFPEFCAEVRKAENEDGKRKGIWYNKNILKKLVYRNWKYVCLPHLGGDREGSGWAKDWSASCAAGCATSCKAPRFE